MANEKSLAINLTGFLGRGKMLGIVEQQHSKK